jgi:hypothetical protein
LKNKVLIITIIFFLIVNTSYYWEGKFGLFIFPIFLILIIIFLGLVIALAKQLYFAFKDNFKDRIPTICLLITVLILTFVKPFGIIDFEKFEGKDLLIAEREGVANCMTTLKLKESNKFTQRSICFGMTEINGNYRLKNDTIFFENVNLGLEKEFYQFAIILPSKLLMNSGQIALVRFKSKTDTIGDELFITKNKLKTMNQKPNR